MTERLPEAERHARELLDGRTVWAVNSSALGGGVAQLMRTLLPYWRGAGIDVRWMVVQGSPEFFRVTKRLHNQLHGVRGDGGPLGADELAVLDRTAAEHVQALAPVIRAGDVVLLHDPQTAALSVPLKRLGATVIWRCHVGTDHPDAVVQHAWSCLIPRLAGVDHFVFSRGAFVPPWLRRDEVSVLTPAIDPASTMSRPMSPGAARAILVHLQLAAGRASAAATYERTDGARATLSGRPTLLDTDGPPDWERTPVVVSLARWDRLKEPLGILDGFLGRVLPRVDAHLLLAGPDASQIADDPEAAAVLAEVRAVWGRLPGAQRSRVHVVCLPLEPPEENAAMVSAIQHSAAVVVKKSLQEGFGLGVTEAMWKARPVVASAVGGHLEQVEHEHSGLLVEDPTNAGAFGDAVVKLLRDPALARRLGRTGRERVRALFLSDWHFLRWVEVLEAALAREHDMTQRGDRTAAPLRPARLDTGALHLADHDHLTGLWNRRRFEEELDRNLAHVRGGDARVALLSVDVDAYRAVIDRHGERDAENLIRSIAHTMTGRLRSNASIARLGGDEFAILLADATPDLVGRTADDLCAAVRAEPHVVGKSRVEATISIGAVFLDEDTPTRHDALLAADTAVYEAKASGGGCAVLRDVKTPAGETSRAE